MRGEKLRISDIAALLRRDRESSDRMAKARPWEKSVSAIGNKQDIMDARSHRIGYTTMKVLIQLSEREEAKALPILLRQSPGVALRNRMYVVMGPVLDTLRASGIAFRVVSRHEDSFADGGVAAGERV